MLDAFPLLQQLIFEGLEVISNPCDDAQQKITSIIHQVALDYLFFTRNALHQIIDRQLVDFVEPKPFARLPDELRSGTEKSEWNAGQPAGLHASSFLEGPSFDRDGILWCVDVVNGRILNIDQNGRFSVAVEYDGWPNGLKIRDDGLVFIADYKHGIMMYEPGSKLVKPFLVRAGMERFKAVNDLFFAANGDLFFTDQGLTGLHDPTGRLPSNA